MAGAEARDPSRFAFGPRARAEIEALLRERWDPDGLLTETARRRRSSDPAAPRTREDFTIAICGMLAAGGTKADVAAYLNREELSLLGAPRSTPRELGAIGRAAWLAARGSLEDGDDA